ncbi:hypothetical protein AU210_015672 [Fusarium oxysporum f. sp. radicis-cucumerinum]|uniref:10TM putative phosphate transporter extracellular tail domain-containing protein n=1 Tax=Fusarium oxysporum f. sp. radicis-cucumerinum TaxID=327505 RepID=A0A2H3G9S4_FUSOX|nr:hypothetical protein AU210_015672 [Fusarium oxysporum f. sp. radicis-cucumerinum]
MFTLSFKFANRTPRSMYYKWTALSTLSWGSLMPIYTNMAVISIVYSVLCPFSATLVDYRHGAVLSRLPLQCTVCCRGRDRHPWSDLPSGPETALIGIPLSLQFQENQVDRSQQQNEEDGHAQNGVGPNCTGASKSNLTSRAVLRATRKGRKKANSVFKWLKLWIYADYATVDQLVPSVTSQAPFLWVPADGDVGISKQEIFDTGKVIPISNKGCKLDDSNHIQWDTEELRPPDWCDKINY